MMGGQEKRLSSAGRPHGSGGQSVEAGRQIPMVQIGYRTMKEDCDCTIRLVFFEASVEDWQANREKNLIREGSARRTWASLLHSSLRHGPNSDLLTAGGNAGDPKKRESWVPIAWTRFQAELSDPKFESFGE